MRFLAAIRAGNDIEDAAHFAGITGSLVHLWLSRGRNQTKGEFVEFFEAYKKAQADCRVELLRYIIEDPAWQAKAWVLERTKPERYSNDRRRHVNDILEKLQETLPPEILQQVADALSPQSGK